jgi:diadenosine tetraphosphatase ApaH/serine/threonine PP2A family protein phosphatase
MLQWVAAQLTPEHVAAIQAWPATTRVGDVVFCHATPRDANEFVNAATPDEAFAAIFETAGVPTVVCGHTHGQYDRRAGRVRVVNAGSVGMPFRGAGAYWLLIDGEPQLRQTGYDAAPAAARISATSYPEADAFADTYVRGPAGKR